MMTESKVSLTKGFNRYFSVKLADSPAERQDIYRIRYNVYCKEFKYESINAFPDELETDEYDEISRHCLITHRETGIPAGCVRLVPTQGSRDNDPLPLEKYCRESLDLSLLDNMALERQTVCEISRLAVDGFFRRRAGETLSRFGNVFSFSEQEQRTFSLIAVACFLAGNVLTELEGKPNMFAMMEPFLPRLLHRSGIFFERVGKDIDYHGIRAPYYCTTQSVLTNLHSDLRELYQSIKEEMLQ